MLLMYLYVAYSIIIYTLREQKELILHCDEQIKFLLLKIIDKSIDLSWVYKCKASVFCYLKFDRSTSHHISEDSTIYSVYSKLYMMIIVIDTRA